VILKAISFHEIGRQHTTEENKTIHEITRNITKRTPELGNARAVLNSRRRIRFTQGVLALRPYCHCDAGSENRQQHQQRTQPPGNPFHVIPPAKSFFRRASENCDERRSRTRYTEVCKNLWRGFTHGFCC